MDHLFSYQGKISRRTFALTGFLLFVIKYSLDKLIAMQNHRPWFLTDYFIQPDHLSVTNLDPDSRKFYLTLIAVSLPFIWCGVVLCLKRLRDIRLPLWLVGFFFIPFINVLFFILLCILPSNAEGATEEEKPRFLNRLIPKSETSSILFSIGITVIVALLFTAFSVSVIEEYGWGLFVAIPFFIGFTSVMLYAYHHQPVSRKKAIGIGVTGISFFAIFLFGLAMEGVICIAMAAPFGYILGMMGSLLAYAIQHQPQRASLNSIAVFVFALPGMMWIEKHSNIEATVYELKTGIIINQPPQKVWNQLISFSTIDPPEEFIFKTGIAYPVDAKITGQGVGAIRYCNFTTGPFVEPITVWNEPRLLKFDVLKQPQPMIEMSVYDEVHAPHLNGYFYSLQGEFKLTPINAHQTFLEGTTWYKNEMWPSFYWKQWTDIILHKIHFRVLQHIKKKAEDDHH